MSNIEFSFEHPNNFKYFARCRSCPDVNLENGDYGPGPKELTDEENGTTLDNAQKQAVEHLKSRPNHSVFIDRFRRF